jgi:MEMO1 family protein
MLRRPAVAGRFYPGKREELQKTIEGFLHPVPKVPVLGAIIPHAGYMYSGHVAGAVYEHIQLPQRNIVLCPNHTGFGTPLSIMQSGTWLTPLGEIEIDEELSNALMQSDPDLQNDSEAHRSEHAIEVQLPFVQHIAGRSAKFVPIVVGTGDWGELEELGRAIGQVVKTVAGDVLIVASSDMNHYESDAVTRVKDQKAIEKVLMMDSPGLYDVVHRENISMCGYGPAVVMLNAAKMLGASGADLVRYATSGDVSGDFDRVVGYAGMVVV